MSLFTLLFLLLSIVTCQKTETGAHTTRQHFANTTPAQAVPLNQFLPYGRGGMTVIQQLPTTADGVTKVRKTLPNGNYTQCEFAVTNVTPKDNSGIFRGPQYSCTECNFVYCGNPIAYSGSFNQQKNKKHDQYDKAEATYKALVTEFAAQPASVLAAANQEALKHENIKFTLMTWNCYAFPKSTVDAVKKITGRDMQEGVILSTSERIAQQAHVVKTKQPDVVCFQELWYDDNKREMDDALKDVYPYRYWRNQETSSEGAKNFFKTAVTDPEKLGHHETWNPFKLDSGLMIVSKFPLIRVDFITFDDKAGDERDAQKGALVVWFKDRRGNDVLLATAHLQSWTDVPYVTIRRNQFRQLGKFMNLVKSDWKTVNPTLVVVGDLNDPITYMEAPDRCSPCCDLNKPKDPQDKDKLDDWLRCKKLCGCSPCCDPKKEDCDKLCVSLQEPIQTSQCNWICKLYGQPPHQQEPRRLVDRTGLLVKALQDNGINVTYNEVTNLLKKKYAIAEHLEVNEIEAKIVVRGPTGQLLRTVDKNSKKDPVWSFGWGIDMPPETKQCEFNQHTFRLCIIGLGWWFNPWENASVRDHMQLIDHIFLDGTTKLLDYQLLRKEAFGDTPKAQNGGWDPFVAISDHMPLYVVLGSY